MADIDTNLTYDVTRAPIVVLANSTEFLTVASGEHAGMPTAFKTRMSTVWVGLNGTFGTITSASVKFLGDRKEVSAGKAGQVRALTWLKPGYGLDLTVHHDRGLPVLRKGDRFTAWVDGGNGREIVPFHIEDLSSDQGDEDTVTLKITAEHRPGLDNLSQLIRAEIDAYGRVITYDDATKFTGAGTDPAAALPTAPGTP